MLVDVNTLDIAEHKGFFPLISTIPNIPPSAFPLFPECHRCQNCLVQINFSTFYSLLLLSHIPVPFSPSAVCITQICDSR